MKNIFTSIWSMLLLVMVAATQLAVTSCSDDNGGGGQPVITGIRVCDPEKADSLFVKSSQGQVIAIIGQNLGNARTVHIAGKKVSLSVTMNTDHSIIVTVPSESEEFDITQVKAEDAQIVVETPGGIATFPFKVLGQSPSIERLQGAYPRVPGDIVQVYGQNLIDIEKVYFTNVTPELLDTTKWEDIPGDHVAANFRISKTERYLDTKNMRYEVSSIVDVTVPELPYKSGTIVLECAAGTRYFAYASSLAKPVISFISSDMPEIGECVTITGTELMQVKSITYGDVTIPATGITVDEETGAEVSFMFQAVPTKGSGTTLVLNTAGGEALVENFYNYDCLLNDFDNMIAAGTATNEGWGPDAEYTTACPLGGTGTMAHLNTQGSWWDQMVFFKKDWSGEPMNLPGFDIIPAETPGDEIYLAMEVFDNFSPWNNGGTDYQGYIRYDIWLANNMNESSSSETYDNFAWDDYGAGTFLNPDGPVLEDVFGNAQPGIWYRHTLPLSRFKNYAGLTYGEIRDKGLGILRLMVLNQGAKPGKMDVYIDNIRIVHIKK